MESAVASPARAITVELVWELLLFGVGLFVFVWSLDALKLSWALCFAADGGSGMTHSIVAQAVGTPLKGLFAGILATSLIQSSSATVAVVVATIGSGVLPLELAVPIIFGANIGTTITNTIVSLGHAHRHDEFRHVIAPAIVDDIYKVFNIALVFVIELATGAFSGLATWVHELSPDTGAARLFDAFPDLLEFITGWALSAYEGVITAGIGTGYGAAVASALIAFAALAGALTLMSRAMKNLFAETARQKVQQVFAHRGRSIAVGFALCWLLQSSSVATSLALPMAAHGFVQLQQVYWYALGAGLGTTLDAGQLASYVKFGLLGVAIGAVHISVNVLGTLLWGFVPQLRDLPIRCAEWLGERIANARGSALWLIVFVAITFYGLPALVIFVF